MAETAGRILHTRVTRLEMTQRPTFTPPVPVGMRLAIMRATNTPVHFYRYLYEQVGRPHHWTMRRLQSDEELVRAIHAETCEIHILYVDGCPVGFAETDYAVPHQAEILHFGLMCDYQGRGLGKFFLHETVSAAWLKDPQKIIIQTNTLDSPRALQLYQKMGFSPVSWSEETVIAWD
ncbi:GNAT family N-acetyltransferase [Daeguia caeni]|uniref:GNAT family N-acetyltransferase n=1 Tax=Daeguia caeni TaxID=439612 RepID=A0ABV9H6M9_9HYPH